MQARIAQTRPQATTRLAGLALHLNVPFLGDLFELSYAYLTIWKNGSYLQSATHRFDVLRQRAQVKVCPVFNFRHLSLIYTQTLREFGLSHLPGFAQLLQRHGRYRFSDAFGDLLPAIGRHGIEQLTEFAYWHYNPPRATKRART